MPNPPTDVPPSTDLHPRPGLRPDMAPAEVNAEHSVLLRCMARLQTLGDQLAGRERRVRQLERENLLLRGQQLVARTAWLWGLRTEAMLRQRAAVVRPEPVSDPALREAGSVICQTGCVGHAHHWLGDEGQCRRSGLPCERLSGEATAVAQDRSSQR